MASICFRCALRSRIAESSRHRAPSKRTFTSSTTRRKGPLPQFTPTSQPELDNVLASLRDKWLIPAALSNQERNLIFKPKYKEQLEQNPEVVTIGDEDVELHHIDRFADVPSLKKELLPKIIELMSKGERSDWNNLPALLAGLTKAKLTPRRGIMGKIARKAIEAGRFGTILQCLQQAELTQMTLRKREVLRNVVYALREVAQREQWSEEATSKALRDANAVAAMLEDKANGSGTETRLNDPRTDPYVLAVYLELAAVYAYEHQEAKDVDGKVRVYAERLLSNLKAVEQKPSEEIERNPGVRVSCPLNADGVRANLFSARYDYTSTYRSTERGPERCSDLPRAVSSNQNLERRNATI